MNKTRTGFKRLMAIAKTELRAILSCLVLTAALSIVAAAQQSSAQTGGPASQGPSSPVAAPSPPNPAPDPFYAPTPHPNETRFFQHLAEDQKDISPARFT